MLSRKCIALAPAILLSAGAFAQQTYTWDQIRDKFKSSNPTLKAGEIGIDESKAQEITAYLRPNPDFSAFVDQIDLFSGNPYRPLSETFPSVAGSYLHERQHKRELRLESSKKGTVVARSQQLDLERNLVFNLRT